jgi:hypothetical protein
MHCNEGESQMQLFIHFLFFQEARWVIQDKKLPIKLT